MKIGTYVTPKSVKIAEANHIPFHILIGWGVVVSVGEHDVLVKFNTDAGDETYWIPKNGLYVFGQKIERISSI